MNKIILVGRVVRDPKKAGKVTYITVAHEDFKKVAHFYDFSIIGENQQKFTNEFVKKGDLVAIEGYLSTFTSENEAYPKITLAASRVDKLASAKPKE